MICAIHQPNFFPWLGYFRKIVRADTFIFLDNVQFPRTSRGTWSNRVKLLVGGEARWVTCPVRRDKTAEQRISDIEINDGEPWREKMIKTLHANYAKALHFDEVMNWASDLLRMDQANLAQFNMQVIEKTALYVGLKCDFVLASDLENRYSATCSSREHRGSILLANLCQAVGADAYLAGDGAGDYERPEVYSEAGITLMGNQFSCEPYPQCGAAGEFVAGLSVLDALFNIGADGVRTLLGDTVSGAA